MKKTLHLLKTSLIATVIFAVLLCVVYPLVVFCIGQVLFHGKANGSLVRDKNGVIIGSKLIGQNFQSDIYFHPRPSSAGKDGYDASNSSASNLGPTSQKLIDSIKSNIDDYRNTNGLSEFASIPVDAVTGSASGLDPDISLSNALMQMPRVAKAPNLSEDEMKEIIDQHTKRSFLGLLGPARVNVLMINMALDEISPKQSLTSP